MGTVEGLGVDTVQLAHPGGQIAFRSFDQQVVVVVHQAVGMAEPVEAPDNLTRELKEQLTVAVIWKMSARALPRAVT